MTELVHTRAWHRFTPAQRFTRFTVYLAIVAAIVEDTDDVDVGIFLRPDDLDQGFAGLRPPTSDL